MFRGAGFSTEGRVELGVELLGLLSLLAVGVGGFAKLCLSPFWFDYLLAVIVSLQLGGEHLDRSDQVRSIELAAIFICARTVECRFSLSHSILPLFSFSYWARGVE